MAHKAYGPAHQRTRVVLLRLLAEMWRLHRADPENYPAPLCPRCGEPLETWQPLDCGHTREADKLRGLPGDRLEHAGCNRGAGASRTTVQPSGYSPSQQW